MTRHPRIVLRSGTLRAVEHRDLATSGLSALNKWRITECDAWMAKREDREYREPPAWMAVRKPVLVQRR